MLNSLHARLLSKIAFVVPADFFSKLTFSKKSPSSTIKVSKSLDPDQDEHSVSPDLNPKTVYKGYQQI